ncbi:right-handed parallel beta-helix repeat-containing protein [Tichowtungia aerotolerans]|uniref:Right handed beta helix domain-containing protein n=1 Tax=Tichowtungia aerotolerans TaxID=2697043 RepID=A0A6P1MFG6_9BACT|nr:right-handed parallel beta-helix repeat-containing protein [Tichowtungia aerotolerans]QHI69815.1 hypothetical protein GT409_10260 [Tichowtungia aerotolerans]
MRRIIICFLLYVAELAFSAASVEQEVMSADELRQHILEKRSAPLTCLNVKATLNVRDFGAVPNDGKDDRPAIASAVLKARRMEGPVQISFESGCYDIQPATDDYIYSDHTNSGVFLRDCRDMVIEGNGAHMLIHRQDVSVFAAVHSTNIIIRNFTADYDPLPFSQGTVCSINEANNSFVFELQSGFPRPDDAFFKSCDSWGMLKDTEHPGRLKADCPSVFFFDEMTPVERNKYRIVLKNPGRTSYFTKGDVFAITGRSASIGWYNDSDNITFNNITAYACPSPVFIGTETSRLNVLNCRMKLIGKRLMTNGGGGVICQASRIGPWVENCEFEGLSDDCLNIYGLPIYILEQISPVKMRVYAKAAIQPGDRLAFFNPNEGNVIQETTVVSFSKNILVLKDPVGKLNTVPPGAKRTKVNPREWKIYDHAYNLNAVGNYYVYRNNTMHDGRRYGVLLRASYGLIENNRFEGLSRTGMQISNEPEWPEGFWTRNLIVRGNRVSECGYGHGDPSIQIKSLKLHGVMDAPIQKNIFLIDNEFHAVSGPAAVFDGVDGLTVNGNVFDSGSAFGSLVVGENVKLRSLEDNTGDSRFEFKHSISR